MEAQGSEWQGKGATLSGKTACKECGLTPGILHRAAHAGKLQYREGSIYGNPFLRLLRREVEALVETGSGTAFLKSRQAKSELARIDRELKKLKKQIAVLGERKSTLPADSG